MQLLKGPLNPAATLSLLARGHGWEGGRCMSFTQTALAVNDYVPSNLYK